MGSRKTKTEPRTPRTAPTVQANCFQSTDASPHVQGKEMARLGFHDHTTSDKPEGDLRSLWMFPVGVIQDMAVLAAIGYFVFLR